MATEPPPRQHGDGSRARPSNTAIEGLAHAARPEKRVIPKTARRFNSLELRATGHSEFIALPYELVGLAEAVTLLTQYAGFDDQSKAATGSHAS